MRKNAFQNLNKSKVRGNGWYSHYIAQTYAKTGEPNQRAKGKLDCHTKYFIMRDVVIVRDAKTLDRIEATQQRFVAIGFQGTVVDELPTEESAREGIRVSINPLAGEKEFRFADSRYPHLERKIAPVTYSEIQGVPSGTYAMGLSV